MILMSNNQWYNDPNHDAWKAIGEDCSAEVRVHGLVRAYKEVMPDVLALQEVSRHMAKLMMDQMRSLKLADGSNAEYEYISGGDTPIVYRSDKLLLIESGFFRYDEKIYGLKGEYNNSGTKSYCYGVFKNKADGKIFALMSTHLWWKSSDPNDANYLEGSDEARAYQILQAASKMDTVMEKYDCPCFIMGDFNACMESCCLKAAQWRGWREAHDLATGSRDDTRGHHPCYAWGFERGDAGTFDQAIDHILLKNCDNVEVKHFRRITDEYFDKISDHYPLYIDVTM